MAEVLEMVYSPDELAEIDRIIGLVSHSASRVPEATDAGISAPDSSGEPEEAGSEYEPAAEEPFEGEPEDIGIPPADLDQVADQQGVAVEDITDLVREVDDLTEAAPPQPRLGPQPSREISTLDELDHLTSGEPESMNGRARMPADASVGQADEPRDDRAAEVEDIRAPERDKSPADIPDLSDISFAEGADMPEAGDSDISKIDFGDIPEPPPSARGGEADLRKPDSGILTDDDIASIKEVHDFQYEEPGMKPSRNIRIDNKKKPAERPPVVDFQEAPELPELPSFEEEEPLVHENPDREGRDTRAGMSDRRESGGINLSEAEIQKLKRTILIYSPALRQIIKDAVISDLLPGAETRRLINMIMSGRQERDVRKFLEVKLKRTIPVAAEKAAPGRRRVITSRPEYIMAETERQKRLIKMTRLFGLTALVACVLVVIGYQFVYKPWAAAGKIRRGAVIIREKGDYLKKQKDYAKAEEIFQDVDRNYIKDYVFGYTEYSTAYFDKKEYSYSLGKLNRIYRIQFDQDKPASIDVLNGLGRYYAKVPREYYDSIRSNINPWYYPQSAKKREEWSPLDVAIEFYRRVLVRDRKNIAGLYGIGNAYFSQGQFFKAKKYYEDIVDLQPDSEVGYAGLLNLYIDRNVFRSVIDIHAKLANKNMLDQLPSALLAKLASYYLGKKRTETGNVRIDYGVQSPSFKDADDNIYPAVYTVLDALNKRDKDYPPLHYQYARLSEARNNLKLMKIHLEKAIDLSLKDYKTDYFSALSLMGEYYYQIKEPVKAYEYLNRAIKAAANPPEFTREEFYTETENVGKSYARLGDVFYYFFDKVRMRYGDLEDENLDEEVDKHANYDIARDKYERALQEGFESSEVHYNLGRIYYLNRLYQKALDQWLNLYEDFVARPELMFALGNAFYHLANFNAAKGEYLKLISTFEYELDKIKSVDHTSKSHVKMVSFLSAAYNNLGAVYQEQNNEAKSDISYWKAINYTQRINLDNEYARVNLARSFKRAGEPGEPILDESIPYSIDAYHEEMGRQ